MKLTRESIRISLPNGQQIQGDMTIPEHARSLVLFAHGSGSSRLSPRNRFVAAALQARGMATLLMDLLTPEEDESYATRFDIPLLTERVCHTITAVGQRGDVGHLPIGLFGASTGAACAIAAAARMPDAIAGVVSRGGRPDLALEALDSVRVPVFLIVGSLDLPVIPLNEQAFDRMTCPKKLVILEGASHLFEEPGKLEEVARLAGDWFALHAVSSHTSPIIPVL